MKYTLKEDQIINGIRSCIPSDLKRVSLHEPKFIGNEWDYVKECIDTGWVSSVGKFVDRFERQLEEFTGSKRAVAVVNGTAALHIALLLSGVRENDEVLVPTLTFVATINAVAYCGAVPHFVDSEEKTLGINVEKVADYLQEIGVLENGYCYNRCTGRRIKAIVPMHTFGHPVDMDRLLDVAYHYKLEVVEDSAESLGSYYKNRHTGTFGKLGIFSFNGNKTITTGGGGAILTNDDELGQLAKHITTTAKVASQWEYFHDQIGYNYRMPNLNAALGCAQLEQLPWFIEKKRELAFRYAHALSDVPGLSFFVEPDFAKSNYWLNCILLDEPNVKERDRLLQILCNEGLMSRPVWHLMHTLPMYRNMPAMDLTEAEQLAKRIINIPSGVMV